MSFRTLSRNARFARPAQILQRLDTRRHRRLPPVALARSFVTTSPTWARTIYNPFLDQRLHQAYNIPRSTKKYNTAPELELTDLSYHKLSDATLDTIFDAIEVAAEEREDWDPEFSSGVLTLKIGLNTWVINKQPPAKQIWLSSPVSGPYHFDYMPKERAWISQRNNTELRGLLREELGIDYELQIPED